MAKLSIQQLKRRPPHSKPEGVAPDFYLYEIRVDGIVRYIGKGRDGRMLSHLIDAKKTAARAGVKVANLNPFFRRNLVKAVQRGALIRETKLTSGLTAKAAYEQERELIGDFHKNRTGQLWNTIDERFMDPKYLPDQWSNPINPLYRLQRPLDPEVLKVAARPDHR